ncbi:MAG: PEP-CTERM sorting domain-containing protein [Pirellulaceae bacterium]
MKKEFKTISGPSQVALWNDSLSGSFSMAVVNPGLGTTITGSLSAYNEAQAWRANVPESSSCALLGLSLDLVGWGAYRRRRT